MLSVDSGNQRRRADAIAAGRCLSAASGDSLTSITTPTPLTRSPRLRVLWQHRCDHANLRLARARRQPVATVTIRGTRQAERERSECGSLGSHPRQQSHPPVPWSRSIRHPCLEGTGIDRAEAIDEFREFAGGIVILRRVDAFHALGVEPAQQRQSGICQAGAGDRPAAASDVKRTPVRVVCSSESPRRRTQPQTLMRSTWFPSCSKNSSGSLR